MSIELKATSALLIIATAVSCSFASDLRPISSESGICLKGAPDLNIRLYRPVDVDIANLVYKNHVIGRFETTILGPEFPLAGRALKRWREGYVVLVEGKGGYVGVKKDPAGGAAYPSVNVYLSLGRNAPAMFTTDSLMKALTSCAFNAHPILGPPPEVDSAVGDAS